MKHVILIGAFLIFGAPARAKITKKQQPEIAGATIVSSAIVTLTPGEWKKHPLPERHCMAWVTFLTGDTEMPEATVAHVSADPGAGRSEGYLLVKPLVEVPDEAFTRVTKQIAFWWGGIKLPHDTTAMDRGEPQSTVITITNRVAFAVPDVLGILDAHYSSQGVPKIELRCADLPRWIIEAHPLAFERLRVFGVRAHRLPSSSAQMSGWLMDEHVLRGGEPYHAYHDFDGTHLRACPLRPGCDLAVHPVLGDEACVDYGACVAITRDAEDNIVWP
ncbi:hypothetical protein HY478_03730 [Candidatus Uhrbacteria bacterium]|nr:hypothetical protein [Candidatus Uhrbacteria bacterium]